MNAKNLARRIEKAATLDECHRIADDVLRELRAASRRRNVKVTPSRQQTRREEHRASTRDLRGFVAKRMDGKCEACGADLGTAWDLHHVESGPDRRAKQRPGSVLGICYECHRGAHRGSDVALRLIAVAMPLDAQARRAAHRRIEKVLEARGVPVRIEVGS